MASGEVEVEVTPQGTLAERMRAAGAGIPAFYTPTGVGTRRRRGQGGARDRRPRLPARARAHGRLRPGARRMSAIRSATCASGARRGTSRPVMATAARTTIVEVDQLVRLGDDRSRRRPPLGHLRPPDPARRRSTRIRSSTAPSARGRSAGPTGRAERWRGSARRWPGGPPRRFDRGSIVNLGIGLPTLVADYLPEALGAWLHSENGLLGMGPFPFDGRGGPAAHQRRQADRHGAARRRPPSTRRCPSP